MKPQTFNRLLGLVVSATVVGCFIEIARGNSTPKEAFLFSVLLTISSVIASAVVTKHYADYSASDNLKVFALKAAEKVTNLSNELGKLAKYLQDELETPVSDYGSPGENLLAKELKIEFAIQMVSTLKSVNDKSLSDWQGVIGEEISAQQEEREEEQRQLKELVESLEALRSEIPHEVETGNSDEMSQAAIAQLDALKREVRSLAAQISGVTFKRPVLAKAKRQTVQKQCPVCANPLTYRQRPLAGGLKGLPCPGCHTDLVSRYQNGDFSLSKKQKLQEHLVCAGCKSIVALELGETPGSQQQATCPACQIDLTAVRGAREVRVRRAGSVASSTAKVVIVDEEFIQLVKKQMPQQPWPKGAAKALANQLGVHTQAVADAISVLVRRGDFKFQMDGQLFDVVPTKTSE